MNNEKGPTDVMRNFFVPAAEEIFAQAGATKDEAPEMFEEALKILSDKMAILSATLGLSWERVRLYDEQKNALVEDMVLMKKNGTLR